ncbi:MAG TPA: DUF6221 family protein [Jiangellaceae bacterium]
MSELVAFLRACLDKDEWWAREASRLREQEGQPAGDHWQWEEGEGDQVLALDPAQSEYVGDEHGSVRVSLRSRELYPTPYVGDLPNFAIGTAEEVPTTVAGHIVRHDPVRVLAEVAAKRQILDEHFGFLHSGGDPERACRQCSDRRADHDPLSHGSNDDLWVRLEPAPCLTVRLLALPYADQPGYREEWRP